MNDRITIPLHRAGPVRVLSRVFVNSCPQVDGTAIFWYTKENDDAEKEGAAVTPQAYELISMLMRYVFVIIGLMIVWRSFRWLRRDARAYQKELRSLPDAGLVGEMVNLATGEAQPLPREGMIGSSRECDIRLKGTGIRRNIARFEFEEGKGLKIIPLRRASVLLNGTAMSGPGYALHGTQLQTAGIPLRVRLFAGLKVPYPAAYPEPDAVWNAGVNPGLWQEPAEPEEDEANLPGGYEAFLPDSRNYDGNFTPDGQITWQYAYTTDELQTAMEEEKWRRVQPDGQVPESEEYPSFIPPVRRRRRRDRHA